jgi:hypothetical protein
MIDPVRLALIGCGRIAQVAPTAARVRADLLRWHAEAGPDNDLPEAIAPTSRWLTSRAA